MSYDKMLGALESLRQKFTSGNSVPVERAVITRAEYEALTSAQQSAEPVAIVAGYYGGRCVVEPTNRTMVMPTGMGLFSTPSPAPEQREKVELTDAEIDAEWDAIGGIKEFLRGFGYRQFARAVIAAHEAKQNGGEA